MTRCDPTFNRMSLFCEATGERKYLNRVERKRFYAAVGILENPCDRTFVLMVYWTGCRPSEALALRANHIDLDEACITFRSLKKRGLLKGKSFRIVPVPAEFVRLLEEVHDLRSAQRQADRARTAKLWEFSRTTAWRRMRRVMMAAGITGAMASARGLRHSFGVVCALGNIVQSRIQVWLGHSDSATTSAYIDLASAEDRELAKRIWPKANVGLMSWVFNYVRNVFKNLHAS